MKFPRLGLCCLFREQPIKFRTTTATALQRLPRQRQLQRLADLCLANAQALLAALEFCRQNGIGCFRVNSQILPVKTHPAVGYRIEDLPGSQEIVAQFERCGEFVRRHKLRACFHPDQFVVLNSPRADVVASSIAELDYQAEVAEWIGADVINIHAGGGYGDKTSALERFAKCLTKLPGRVRQRLTVENDDVTYTPADLLPLCRAEGLPLVYDVHHHRCNPDGLSIEQATRRALATWKLAAGKLGTGNREPLFHISSPIAGWDGPHRRRHHDFIDWPDFPSCWSRKRITIEVEAKAKELAVARLLADLREFAQPAAAGLVYILRCADGTLYAGITNDLPRRCAQHNAGTASRYTRSRLPVELVYQESQASQSAALKRELAIKALSRRAKDALIRSAR
jgi:UV DNA damage endonuclease